MELEIVQTTACDTIFSVRVIYDANTGVIIDVLPAAPSYDLTGWDEGDYVAVQLCYDELPSGLAQGNNYSDITGCFSASNEQAFQITTCPMNRYYIDRLACNISGSGVNSSSSLVVTTTSGVLTVTQSSGFTGVAHLLNQLTGEINTAAWECIDNILVYQGAYEILSISYRMGWGGGPNHPMTYEAKPWDGVISNLPTYSCYQILGSPPDSGAVTQVVVDGVAYPYPTTNFNDAPLFSAGLGVQPFVGESTGGNQIQSFNIINSVSVKATATSSAVVYNAAPC